MDRLEQILLEIYEWSDKTFGLDVHPKSKIAHLKKEIKELHEKPFDLLEYADCFMLLFDAFRKSGFTMEDLNNALHTKLDINKKRKWGKPDSDGIVEHIKEIPKLPCDNVKDFNYRSCILCEFCTYEEDK